MPNTALLIIDVQNTVVAGAHRLNETSPSSPTSRPGARAAGASRFSTCSTPTPRKPPSTTARRAGAIHPAVAPEPGETVIEKTASDGFYATSLKAELARRDVSRLIICGAW